MFSKYESGIQLNAHCLICSQIGESLPASAKRTLGYLSSKLLAQLMQDTTLGEHLQCTGNASSWTSTEVYDTYAITNPFGMGWHLDRAAFDELMRDEVREIAKSQTKDGYVRCSVEKGKFISAEKREDGWRVHAEAASTMKHYRSKWLVDATGRKASVAHKASAFSTLKIQLFEPDIHLYSSEPKQ